MQFPIPRIVLLCPPDWFTVVDVKNPHMDPVAAPINHDLATDQWLKLRAIYKNLQVNGLLDEVAGITPGKELEDMVFCANQSFPWVRESGEKVAIMSKMRHPSRQQEVPHFENWYRERGYEILHLNETDLFEGMGDLIPLPGTRTLFGGYGFRTNPAAYEEIARILDVEIIPLELVNPLFYHLDTCFLPISTDTALACRSAFSDSGWEKLKSHIPNLLESDEAEAAQGFALNAHVIPARNDHPAVAIIQSGNPYTISLLKDRGVEVFETETSEFIKSGGSVFCMKMMLF